jgi:hypothetical protein
MAGEGRFKKLRAKRTDLEKAVQDRLKDADVLFAAGCFASSIAMGIYALEIQLKIVICRRLDLDALPQAFETHDLDELLLLAGLQRRMNDASAAKVKFNWSAITINKTQDYLNDLRYLPAAHCSQAMAAEFLERLRDPADGVLPWITTQP